MSRAVLTTDADRIRERILDAAEECLMELGYTKRLHAVIAERAGVSRPTVYKYVGDQPAITEALLLREVGKFFAALDPLLRGNERGLQVGFVDAVVFAVQYGRNHALLQKGLREHPELVLPWFTVKAGPTLELATNLLAPHFRRLFTAEQLAVTEPAAISEWAFRVICSLLITQGAVDTDDPEALRHFVSALLGIAFIPPADPQVSG